jgi:hypothetical protein
MSATDQPKDGDFASHLKGLGSAVVTFHALTPAQFLLAVGYAAFFPLTNLVGGALAMFGIVVTLPFLPIGWVAGMALVSITKSEPTYLVGVFIAVLAQVVMLTWAWNSSKDRNASPQI